MDDEVVEIDETSSAQPPENLPRPKMDDFFEWYLNHCLKQLRQAQENKARRGRDTGSRFGCLSMIWNQLCCCSDHEAESDDEEVVTPQHGPTDESSCPQASTSNGTPHVIVEVENEEAGNSSLRSSLRQRRSFRSVATTFIRVRSLFQPNPTGDNVEEFEMEPMGSAQSVDTAVTNLDEIVEFSQ